MSFNRPRGRRQTHRLQLERLEARLSPAVVSLRTGLGASMVSDIGISATSPTTPLAGATAIGVEAGRAGPTRQGLLRFESLFGSGPQQIPFGSTIVSASLAVWVGAAGSSATPIQLHRMLVPWTATTATWNSFNGNGTPGIQADGVEALAAADNSNAVTATGTGYRVIGGLAAAIQAWASGATNNGWVLTVPGTSTGWSFDASESTSADHRPTLTIQYAPPAPSPFPTYVDLAGAPPMVTQSNWFTWQTDLETQRLNRVPSARTHTYYFAQNGNDSTGTGEMNSPWRTLAHAQSILSASSGDVRLRFRRGDTWREATTLQIHRESVTIDSYGDTNLAAPLFSRFTRTYTSGWTFHEAEGLWSRSEATPIGWLRTVNNPESTIFYRAAFKAEAAARPGSWLYDHVASRLYLSSVTDPNTVVGGFEASLADGAGWTVTSDDVRLENLQIQGSGMATTGEGAAIEIVQPAGSEFVGINVAATWAGGRGIRIVGSASAATLIGCTAGWLENRGGTGLTGSGDVVPFDIDSGSGGHELILRDCTVIGGALPSADWNGRVGARHGRFGVLQHNQGPALPPALSVALRTKYPDRGWQVAGGTSIFGPSAATLADVRAYIVGESPADGIDSQPGAGSSDRVYVNNVYTHLAAGRPVGRPLALYSGGVYDSWVINTTVRVDASQLAADRLYSWYRTSSPINVRIENSRFEITSLDTRNFEFVPGDSAIGPNFHLRNNILIANGSRPNSLGSAIGVGRLDHNGYAFSSSLPGLTAIDPAGVILTSPPSNTHVPRPDDDPLHGGGVLTGLQFDQFGQPRPTNRNEIGPTVGVTANPTERNRLYHQLSGVGQPPSPDDPAWFAWEERLRAARLSNVPLSRTTTYYFAQTGNDLTGDGSAASPFQSLTWARGLLSAPLAAFSGGGSQLVAPDLPAFQPNGKDFTIAFWGNFQNTSFSTVAAKTGSWTMGYLDNQRIGIRLLDANQGTVAQVMWPSILSPGWHYFVAGYDAAQDRLRLSIDGAPAISVVSPADPIAGTEPLRLFTIGAVGRMDDAAYWSSAPAAGGSLSDSAVATLYSAGRGKRYEEIAPSMRTNLSAWWQLNEPGGSAAYFDRVGAAHLALQGAGLVQHQGYQTGAADLRLRFRGGDTWRDDAGLDVQRSQVTVDSYGEGTPYFTRFTHTFAGGWTHVTGNLWKRAESANIAWLRPAANPLETIYKSEQSSAFTAGYAFSFFHDATGADPNSDGIPTLYLNPGESVNPNLVTGGFEAARLGGGWSVQSDNVRLQNLKVHGAGLDKAGGSNPGYGLVISHYNLFRAEFVGVGLEFYFTGYHSIGHNAQSSGSMTLVDCRVGLCAAAAGGIGRDATPFVSYSANGGQEMLMADNEVSYGALPSWDWNAQPGERRGSYGIYQHTNGGPTASLLSIALRTRFPDNPWQVINSTRIFTLPAANLAGVRAYIIGEAPADGISSQPGYGLNDCVYVNNVYEHLIHRPKSNTIALYYGQFSSWVINTTVKVDATDWLYTFWGHAIYFGSSVTNNVKLINSRFEVFNNNLQEFFFIQPYNSPVGGSFLMQNCIFSVNGTKPGRLGPIGLGRLDRNAYFSQVPPTGGMGATNDPAPVILNRAPIDGAPAFSNPLAGAGAVNNLGFDSAGRPRSNRRMDIGPWAAAPLATPIDLRLGLATPIDPRSLLVPSATQRLTPGVNSIPAPVDRIIAQFDTEPDVGIWSLSLIGLDGQSIRVASFTYDPLSRTATWKLQSPLSGGRIRLNLDSSTTVDFQLITLNGL